MENLKLWWFINQTMVDFQFTLWWTNIAIENGHRNSGFSHKNGDFPWQNVSSPEGKSYHNQLWKVRDHRCHEAPEPSPCLSAGWRVARGVGQRESAGSDPCTGRHVGAQAMGWRNGAGKVGFNWVKLRETFGKPRVHGVWEDLPPRWYFGKVRLSHIQWNGSNYPISRQLQVELPLVRFLRGCLSAVFSLQVSTGFFFFSLSLSLFLSLPRSLAPSLPRSLPPSLPLPVSVSLYSDINNYDHSKNDNDDIINDDNDNNDNNGNDNENNR